MRPRAPLEKKQETRRIPKRDLQAVFREYMSLERKREKEGLSLEELQSWTLLKRQLNRKFQPDAKEPIPDRRQSPRVPVKLDVAFISCGEVTECLMTNLSRGGLFVATDSPLPIGTKVRLSARIVELGKTLECATEVVSHSLGADMSGGEFGMGLRFCDLDEAQSALIDDLYQRSATQVLRDAPEDEPEGAG